MFTAPDLFAGIALQEAMVTIPALNRAVPIRELSLAQRYACGEKARRDDAFDTAQWYAWVTAYGTLDALGGNRIIADADVPRLLAGRPDVIEQLANAILTLSEARPADIKSGDYPDDARQLDAETGNALGRTDSQRRG